MKKTLTKDEIKSIQLDILQSIHQFCVDHQLRYSLAFGTLLGAVRHKGYIPWDDDIESVNVELEKAGTTNRILNVSPGSIKGTSFNQGKTDLSLTTPLAGEIVSHVENKDDLFIPQYEEIFKNVLARYQEDFRAEGRHSYEYKKASSRM